MSEPQPFVSVVMPAHRAAHLLTQVLDALMASDYPRERWELIVVDDASGDETPNVAARYADTVVRIPGRPHGPAYARNRGFEVSRGDLVMFFDSDVVVHRDTIRRFVEVMVEHPDVGAVFGSYDLEPTAATFISQYRNLLHHFVHQRNAGEAETFWAGAGAIRRAAFDEAGMYDEWHFARPQIEDIELGGRIRQLGYRILLVPGIQVTHLKHWTFAGVVRTDLRDRGIPWARLLAHRKTVLSSQALSLRWTEKLSTVLTWIGLLGVLASLWFRSPLLAGVSLVGPLTVLFINYDLFAFFARVRGLFFALRVIPMHLLYYILNGISFGIGLFLQQIVGPPLPHPTVEAYAEIGLQRWPPVPSKHRRSSWTANDE